MVKVTASGCLAALMMLVSAEPAWAQSPPTASVSLSPFYVNENGVRAFRVTVSDNNPSLVLVGVSSDNPTLAPPAAFDFLSPFQAVQVILYAPPADRSGTVNLAFNVYDLEYGNVDPNNPRAPDFQVQVGNYPIRPTVAVPRQPTNLSATSQPDGNVLFQWAPAAEGPNSDEAAYFLLEIGDAPQLTSIPAIRVPREVASAQVRLPPGGYNWRVRPVNRLGIGPVSSEASVGHLTGPNIPGPSSGLQIAVAANGVATATWTAPAFGAAPTGYIVEVGTASGLSNIGRFPVGTALSASGSLGPGTYAVRVKGISAAGEGLASQEVFLTIPSSTCSVPSAPTLLPVLRNGPVVSVPWTAPASGQAQGYRLLAGTTPGSANIATLTVGPSSSYYQLAPPAGTYWVTIQALASCGNSAASNSLPYIEPSPAVPGPPQVLTGSSAGRGAAALSWRPPVTGGGVTSYVIEAGFSSGTTAITVPLSRVPGISFTGVPAGTYFVRVRGRNALGNGAVSNEITLTVQ